MKDNLIFKVLIFSPILLLVFFLKKENSNNQYFTVGLFTYSLLYNPLICGLRLLALNKINKHEFFYIFLPFFNFKYYRLLYLNNKKDDIAD